MRRVGHSLQPSLSGFPLGLRPATVRIVSNDFGTQRLWNAPRPDSRPVCRKIAFRQPDRGSMVQAAFELVGPPTSSYVQRHWRVILLTLSAAAIASGWLLHQGKRMGVWKKAW